MSRKAWITGAGKGLGRAVAVRLLQSGWTVAVSARTESDLVTLAAEAGALDQSVVPLAVDVTDEAAMMATAAAIEERIGPLDLVIFNAGTHEPVRAREFAVEPFRKLFETNVMGVVHGLAAVLPRFIARRSGHVVVVSSVAGYRGLVTGAAYGATKAALTNMCEALKPELDRHGVKITVVSPGFIRTPLTDKNPFKMPFLMEPDDAAERLVRGLDSGRFEITFPRRFTWFLKVLRCLPYAIYFPLVRNLDKD
jgi:NAD(P)-dependent dehydrogenase (short-subunit alcohol dehydrogenase family)